MTDIDKTFQCPICIKGKYKECSLIQHLIDKHPDFPASKKLRNEYQFPMTCPLCAQKITAPVSYMTHYKMYHPKEYITLKNDLGFDFDFNDSLFKSGESLSIIPNLNPTPVYVLPNDEKFFQIFHKLVDQSPIMHSLLKPSNLLVICCTKGIILVELNVKGLGEYCQKYIKDKQPIINFNTPNDSSFIESKFGISLPTNIVTDPFICQNYTRFIRTYGPSISSNEDKQIELTKSISKTDLKNALMNIALAYHYLISLNFYPINSNTDKKPECCSKNMFKCPCCDITAANIIFIYRHLYRQHPFPAMIMNQYKMAEQPKGKFICESCHEQNLSSFDDLSIHVYNNHRKELLKKTLDYIEIHQDVKKNNPELENFIKTEYKNLSF